MLVKTLTASVFQKLGLLVHHFRNMECLCMHTCKLIPNFG